MEVCLADSFESASLHSQSTTWETMQRKTASLLMKVKRDRTRKVCVVKFQGVGKGEVWEGMGRVGSGLISLFGRRMSYAPSLFPALELVCGAGSFSGECMGWKSGFGPLIMELRDKYCDVLGTQQPQPSL